MAYPKFPTQVLTPEGLVFDGEVELLSTITVTGSIGIRANHAPFLAITEPTELRLYTDEDNGEIERFAQGEGYLQMQDNRALVLVDEAIKVSELNVAELEQKLQACQDRLDGAAEGSEELQVAKRDERRYKAFLKLASEVIAAE